MQPDIKEKITRLEEKNRLIADNLIDAIWVLDVQTLSYDYITPSIEKISGYTAQELIGRPIQERLTPESFQNIKAVLAQELASLQADKSSVRTVEIELVHKDGSHYWAEIRAKIVREKNDSLKIMGITREITGRKMAERKQQELLLKVEKALEEKTKLLEEIKLLRHLLPICSCCKRIRDEKGKWWPLDVYVQKKTNTDLTHTICQDCKVVFYEDKND